MRYIILIGAFLFCSPVKRLQAQDIRFSQYFSTPQLYNPAFTGYFNGDVRATAIYKSQWIKPFNAYRTIGVGADFGILRNKLKGSGFGVGMHFFSDQAGDLDFNTNEMLLSVGYTQRLSSNFTNNLSAGFQLSGVNRSINLSNSIFEDQLGGSGTSDIVGMDNYWYFSLGLGMLWYAEPIDRVNFYVGGAAFNLLRPNQSFFNNGKDELYVRYVGQAGMNFGINEHIDMNASTMYQRQGPFQEYLIGFLGRYDFMTDDASKDFKMGIGLWYRMQDAIIPVVRFEYNDFMLTFNYDINTSSIIRANRSNGGPEISLTYTGFWNSERKKNANKINILKCPVL